MTQHQAHVDLGGATQRMAELIGAVDDSRLPGPTPCAAYTVGDLLDHIGGLTMAFTGAAIKQPLNGVVEPPVGDASRLTADWRTKIPADLARLAAAWREPSAWSGMTHAGGIEMPGEVAGIVVLDELIAHGWDLARATGQPFQCEPGELEACIEFVSQFSAPDQADLRGDAFATPVATAPDAPLLDQLIALTGRDPRWST